MSVWINKKVYTETSSGKIFIGKIIDESDNKIILIDKFGFMVELSKNDLRVLKEEL